MKDENTMPNTEANGLIDDAGDKPTPREIIAQIEYSWSSARYDFDELPAHYQELFRARAQKVLDGLASFGWTLRRKIRERSPFVKIYDDIAFAIDPDLPPRTIEIHHDGRKDRYLIDGETIVKEGG